MNNYAPILITVYDRFNHLKNAVESLKKCPEAKSTEIFIASDMTSEKEKEIQISEIRNYINSINGFKKVTPIFFDENVGIEHSWHFSLDLVFQKYDKIIFLEDDIEVSPLFLNYINEGLDFYKDDPKVFSICGYSPLIMSNSYNKNFPFKIYLSHSWAGWGVASWKNKFNDLINFRNSSEMFSDIKLNIGSRTFRKKLDKLSLEHYPHLLYSEKQKIIPEFDYLAGYYCLKNNFFNIYANKSYTINNGNDGSGQRAKKNNEISSKMKSEYLSNEILEFKKLNDLSTIEKLPHYSKSSLLIFIKILLIKFRLFKVGKNVYNIFYEFKTNLYEKIIR